MTFVSNVPDETQTLTLAICNRKHSPGGETGASASPCLRSQLRLSRYFFFRMACPTSQSTTIAHSMIDIDIKKKPRRLSHRRPPQIVLRGITALSGRSDFGKTSIMNMIVGLIRPDSGHIVIDGTPLFCFSGIARPGVIAPLGLSVSRDRLFTHLSVKANLRCSCGRRIEAGYFDKVIRLLNVGNLLDRRPISLSGGEKHHVSIDKALLTSSQLL